MAIEEIQGGVAVKSYTRWIDSAQLRVAENEAVYVTFNRRFEHIWLESKKRLLNYAAQKPADAKLRSRYAIRMYDWANRYVSAGKKRITMKELRTMLGLESVKDADGKVIRQAPLPVWANLRQRALDVAIREINQKTDLNIVLESLERSGPRRVDALVFAIKAR